MKAAIIRKDGFEVIQIVDVSSISYANNVFTVTAQGGTTTYSKDDYLVSLLW